VTARAGGATSNAEPGAQGRRSTRERRNALRRELRARRRSLAGGDRSAAEAAIRRTLLNLPVLRAARKVGIYFAFDGEPDLVDVIAAAHASGKKLYAPVLRDKRMYFAAVGRRPLMVRNFFGIHEPHRQVLIDPRRLDVVLTPLVAFDARGTRLGVGRGYYDRRFAFLRRRRAWVRPKLVGVAFSFQEVPDLDPQWWDVPLWAVVTERGTRHIAGTTA
jgi:5-formyltetrahydrofolate cyclo-ligase